MLRTLADLILPRYCAGCGAPGELLCRECARSGPPIEVPGFGVPVQAAGRYERGLRAAVLAYKERGRHELAGPLAAVLAPVVARVAITGAVLVPVPSSRTAARRRGGDHVLRLSRHVGARLGLATLPALALVRRVHDSAGLSAPARAANLAAAMAAPAAPAGATAVLVDDIVTTGVTLHEALRALRDAGWAVSGAATLAMTPLRGRPSTELAERCDANVKYLWPVNPACPPSGTQAKSRLALG